jgi:hypothetical protein
MKNDGPRQSRDFHFQKWTLRIPCLLWLHISDPLVLLFSWASLLFWLLVKFPHRLLPVSMATTIVAIMIINKYMFPCLSVLQNSVCVLPTAFWILSCRFPVDGVLHLELGTAQTKAIIFSKQHNFLFSLLVNRSFSY